MLLLADTVTASIFKNKYSSHSILPEDKNNLQYQGTSQKVCRAPYTYTASTALGLHDLMPMFELARNKVMVAFTNLRDSQTMFRMSLIAHLQISRQFYKLVQWTLFNTAKLLKNCSNVWKHFSFDMYFINLFQITGYAVLT